LASYFAIITTDVQVLKQSIDVLLVLYKVSEIICLSFFYTSTPLPNFDLNRHNDDYLSVSVVYEISSHCFQTS